MKDSFKKFDSQCISQVLPSNAEEKLLEICRKADKDAEDQKHYGPEISLFFVCLKVRLSVDWKSQHEYKLTENKTKQGQIQGSNHTGAETSDCVPQRIVVLHYFTVSDLSVFPTVYRFKRYDAVNFINGGDAFAAY